MHTSSSTSSVYSRVRLGGAGGLLHRSDRASSSSPGGPPPPSPLNSSTGMELAERLGEAATEGVEPWRGAAQRGLGEQSGAASRRGVGERSGVSPAREIASADAMAWRSPAW